MNAPISKLHDELDAAGPNLVGNDEVLRSVLAGCGDCIKILDLAGRLQFMSEGGKRVMEVDDFTVLKGCPWPDFWERDGNKDARDAVEAARAGHVRRFRGVANTAKGNPRHWDVEVSPIFGADGKTQHILSISRDVTVQVQAEQKSRQGAQRQRWLVKEMAHRLKNSLAMVLAIANQSFRGPSLDAPRKVFGDRIIALGAAQDILTRANWASASVASVVEGALAPHKAGRGSFDISGPALNLDSGPSLTLMLALHELATNAAKHGALSMPDGKVEIRWSVDDVDGQPTFVFCWSETGGPAVSRPPSRGFGSRLLERLLPSSFRGRVELDFKSEGVVCRLTAPLAHIEPQNTEAMNEETAMSGLVRAHDETALLER